MADGPNKPNRPIRPRGGGQAGRRRRVVIEGGAARGRDGRQARDRSGQAPAAPKQRWAPPDIVVNAPPSGLDDRRWRDLRRGKVKPERTLDLHGRFAQEAHGAVRAFLADAYADGLRCVAVITGRGSSPEGGVLRRELPHWLNAPDLRRVLLGAAHPHRANTGAVHLLLRRRR